MFERIGEALSGLDNYLSLKSPLAADTPADEEDVLSTKKGLNRRGYYDEPEYGLTPYPDKPLFESIRRFQKDNDLKVDGVMKPGGETETILNRTRLAQADPLEARARDENILRQFIQTRNELRKETTAPESAPPIPQRKPEQKDAIRLAAEKQGEFVGDMVSQSLIRFLKIIPLHNPITRKIFAKSLQQLEEEIGYIPKEVWTSISEKQLRERERQKTTTNK